MPQALAPGYEPNARGEFLTPAHVQAMEDAATTMRDALLVRLLFRSCRVSEVLALTPEDVNFKARLITIKHLKE